MFLSRNYERKNEIANQRFIEHRGLELLNPINNPKIYVLRFESE